MDIESAFGRHHDSRDKVLRLHGARMAGKAVSWTAGLLLAFGLALYAAAPPLGHSEVYRLGQAALERHAGIAEEYGVPLAIGSPSGMMQVSGPDGAANLQFFVAGPRGRGTAYVEARRSLGLWEIEHLVVENDSGARLEVR